MAKRSWKIFCLLLVISVFTSLLGACKATEINETGKEITAATTTSDAEADTTEETTAAEGLTVLSFWNGFTGSDGSILSEIVERFNKEHEGKIRIDMSIIPWDVFLQKVPAAIGTKTAPSFVLMPADWLPQFVSNNSLQPMDDFWTSTGLKESDYVQAVLDLYEYEDGKTYMTPMQYQIQYLYWNKDLFKEAGLDPEKPPETWEELGEFAVKLTDHSKKQYGFASATEDNLSHLIWANGGEFWDINAKKSLFNSEQNIKTLEWLQDLYVNKKVAPPNATGADLDALLTTGKLAMYITGPWQINGCRTNNINFGLAAPPKGTVTQASAIGGCGYSIPSCTPASQKAAIYEFCKYWLSKEVLKEWTMRNGFPPFLKELINDPDVVADPIQKQIAPLGVLGKNYNNGMVIGVSLDRDIIRPIMQAVKAGTMKPADAVKIASEQIDQKFKEN